MKTAILVLGLIFSLSAYAGVGAHGGNIVSCTGQPLVTLDYYNALLPTMKGKADLIEINGMSEDQVMQLIRSRFDGSPFQEIFDQHTQLLGPMDTWIAADLKSIDDSNEPYALPSYCQRKTAAARQGSAMYADPSLIPLLSSEQLGLLHAHEVLYEISGNDSSAPVRDLFRILLAKKLDWPLFLRTMKPIGKFAVWDYLNFKFWQLEASSSPWADVPHPNLNFSVFVEGKKANTVELGDHTINVDEVYDVTCDASTQSCTLGAGNQYGKPVSRLTGCSVTTPHVRQAKLQCPGKSPVTFYHEN